MEEFINAMQEARIPTILVIGGIFFLFLAIGGGIRFITGKVNQRYAGGLGLFLLIAGMALSIPVHTQVPTPSESSTAQPPTSIVPFIETPNQTLAPTETPSLTPTPPVTTCLTESSVITVPADVYWCNTGIAVKQGQQLEFIATGSWWNGISRSDPEGDSTHFCDPLYPVCDNLGVLVGAIGLPNSIPDQLNVVAFKIGNSLTLVTKQDGVLYLAMNENTGDCIPDVPGSCYRGNMGSMNVTVKLK